MANSENLTDDLVRKTPWWFLSVFLHATLFAVAALIVVIARPDPSTEVVKIAAPRPQPPEPEPDIPPDLEDCDVVVESEEESEIIKPGPEFPEDYTPVTPHPEASPTVERPFASSDAHDIIGGGPQGGPPRGHGPWSKRKPKETGDPSRKAVVQALDWLARHQGADGSWSATGYLERCGSDPCAPHGIHPSIRASYDVGLTGLALLAFLGAGYTHASNESFGDVVRAGTQFLMHRQDERGALDDEMYNHAVGTLALVEAYGLTGHVKFSGPAQRAIDFLAAAQNPGRGWRYAARSGENDTSVTGWAVMALKSADMAGLTFDRSVVYDGARAWLDSATYKDGGASDTRWKTGYQSPDGGVVSIPGVNDHFDAHPSMTAVATMCRIFIDKKRDAKVTGGVSVLLEDPPKWDGAATDFYYWYCAGMALFQFTGGERATWKKWNAAMVEALVKHQNLTEGAHRRGSWEPVDRWSCSGGRVYATAINALTLEVYYRYASVFGR